MDNRTREEVIANEDRLIEEKERYRKLKERYQLEKEIYKTRNEKAIEELETWNCMNKAIQYEIDYLLEILQGEDKE